jgi:hypothetical protein
MAHSVNHHIRAIRAKTSSTSSISNQPTGPDFPGETFRVLKEKELAQFGE